MPETHGRCFRHGRQHAELPQTFGQNNFVRVLVLVLDHLRLDTVLNLTHIWRQVILYRNVSFAKTRWQLQMRLVNVIFNVLMNTGVGEKLFGNDKLRRSVSIAEVRHTRNRGIRGMGTYTFCRPRQPEAAGNLSL